MTSLNSEVVSRLIHDVFNGQDWNMFDELHDPNGPIHRAGSIATPAEIKRVHQTRIQAFPDLHWTVERQIEDGDFVVTHATWCGTHRGTYQGLPATGTTVHGEVMAIRRIAHGLIVETWAVADTLRVLNQIGGRITLR